MTIDLLHLARVAASAAREISVSGLRGSVQTEALATILGSWVDARAAITIAGAVTDHPVNLDELRRMLAQTSVRLRAAPSNDLVRVCLEISRLAESAARNP